MLRRIARKLLGRKPAPASHAGEERVIQSLLPDISSAPRYCVDIAASDGLTQSNTYDLLKQGWAGLAVELNPRLFRDLARNYESFEEVGLARVRVEPSNIVEILGAHAAPKDFGFLNLDIDSYDYFVLDQLLGKYRPGLICTEINEKIPPPIRFTVLYTPEHYWKGDHFYGQSLSQLYTLCEKYDYALVELHYNNAFLMPRENKPRRDLQPEEAYEAGYRSRTDRHQLFPWNADMEDLQNMNPEAAVTQIKQRFAAYEKNFLCEV